MAKYTLKEWLDKGKKLFGDDFLKWKFVCPACGKISSVQEFKDVGADANDSYQCCIGRFTGKGAPTKVSKDGCNWAAFGFLGTLGEGDTVIADDGHEVAIFKFADPSKEENNKSEDK